MQGDSTFQADSPGIAEIVGSATPHTFKVQGDPTFRALPGAVETMGDATPHSVKVQGDPMDEAVSSAVTVYEHRNTVSPRAMVSDLGLFEAQDGGAEGSTEQDRQGQDRQGQDSSSSSGRSGSGSGTSSASSSSTSRSSSTGSSASRSPGCSSRGGSSSGSGDGRVAQDEADPWVFAVPSQVELPPGSRVRPQVGQQGREQSLESLLVVPDPTEGRGGAGTRVVAVRVRLRAPCHHPRVGPVEGEAATAEPADLGPTGPLSPDAPRGGQASPRHGSFGRG